MKIVLKSILALSAAALLAVSCNVEAVGTLYEQESGKTGVSFAANLAGDSEISATATSFTIPVRRAAADGSQTVNISSTLPEDIVVPSTVTFSAGQYETDLVLDISSMAVGKTYKGAVKLANEEEYDAKTAISSVSVTLAKAYTWVNIGKGQFYDGLALQPSDDDLGIIEVEILQAEGFDRWRILNPFPKDKLIAAWAESYVTYNPTSEIEFWVNDKDVIEFSPNVIKTGLTYIDLGSDCYIYYYYPSVYSSQLAGDDAKNCFVMDKVAQFYFAQVIENSNNWFGEGAKYLSLPGGPDLNELLQ